MDTSKALTIFREHLKRYIDFNEAEWILFSQHLTFSALKKKHYFAEYGKVCDRVGFIVSGAVRYFHMKDGQDITGYFSFENEFVSSYKSYLTGQPGYVYVQALEDTKLITFTRRDMDQMLANPMLAYKMERFGRLVAEQYLCCYEDRMVSFITQTPEERYLNLLNTGREILQRMPQHYIANFLGITPVSLSRIRRRVLAAVK
ncbi:Crp/Fnr family transcriptional regulator [Mucilaginibacter ginsenosidivorans]|uniref:Crp/Fnr family transcriptional regulator n=1 Tax=Mucilaginibacter ginsenosidivorans TaxID=398053 RepID=A0A5B8V0S4_9SPHI|nr:Crp/Fnr family transcriptional regulator [Mucilaginibacter ginsenosidivorans]QEC65040.1 Crp/Fnr family transcriptional regulator [Mucilaginibacter ginsenosidivorans]